MLLLGAGFSRNWGGWLAAEAFEYLLGCPEVIRDPSLAQLLWRYQPQGGFESALAELQSAYSRDPRSNEPALMGLQAAIKRMFADMNGAFMESAGWEFQNHIERMVGTFLTRFDAIFTLNQDVLLEHHYVNDNIALTGKKKWAGASITLPKTSAKKPGSIARLIEQTVSIRATSKKHIEYKLNLAQNLSQVLFVYEQMNLAIGHLISNAEDAMPDGGILIISADNMRLIEKKVSGSLTLQPGNYVKISVSDQGIGIPSQNLEKVFDPYFTTKEHSSEKGHGLGLTIVYAIIRRHKGNIFVDSKPQAGTTVNVFLPSV